MIPILYKADTTNFNTYGIGALADSTSCIVTEERNGEYELTLKYPSNGQLYNEIKKERIIKAKPNDTSNPQAFRIYRITVPINGVITVYAQHISYDLASISVTPFSLISVSPELAMTNVLSNAVIPNLFTFTSDYSSSKDYSVDKPQSVRACIGGTSGSIMNLWGGEFEWDNFRIIHHQGRGNNNGVVIEYGKNMTKFEQDSNISDVYTDLLPYAVSKDEYDNEVIITLPEQVIPISTTLTNRKSIVKDFTDSFDDEEEITVEKLRGKAENYLKNNPLGIDNPTITISFEALWKQPDYIAILERVSLCDTVTIRHADLGVSVKSKVVKTQYDTLLEKYTSITLGTCKANLVDRVSEAVEEIKVTQKEINRMPSLIASAVSTATSLITGNSGGHVVLHSSEGGEPYELLIMDSENIADAVNVWRWNVSGLGFSKHGYNGPYETAITGDGSIVADFINAGSLVANIIKAGVISSVDGSSYWNIETGEVVLRAYATTETVEEQSSRIDGIEDQKMYRLVINSSNGNIFKNGEISTILTATVLSWDKDVTDELDENQFIWTRVSADHEADTLWNHAHYGGTKSIMITSDDVQARATFYCDLIDTTTRMSLLS